MRERRGLSVDQAATACGIDGRNAYRYDRGQSATPAPILKLLALDEPKAEKKTDSWFKFIDLFAGIGGLRRGFESIGGECVFTSEWDAYSRKTYAANFPVEHEFGGDIREYSANPSRIPTNDVLLAGSPCQPFSIAGV